MRITIIHGQSHKGSTYHITEQMKNKLSNKCNANNKSNACNKNTESSASPIIYEFFMPADAPDFCVGCFRCIMKGEDSCPHQENIQKIVKAIEASDVIIVDSPTYCMEMTGQLKVFFDHLAYMWLSHRPNPAMYAKVGIVVSTAAGAGAKRVSKSISHQLFWLGISKCFQLPVNVNASSWNEVSAEKKNKIEARTDKIAGKAMRKATVGIKSRFMFTVMRMNQKANTWNPIDKNHWEENGWLGKVRPW